MEKNNFIYYKTVNQLLEDKHFFGLTVKRNKKDNRMRYTYCSIKYPHYLITVLVMKLNPNDNRSDKIVIGIKINDNEVNDWNDFIKTLNEITKYKKRKH